MPLSSRQALERVSTTLKRLALSPGSGGFPIVTPSPSVPRSIPRLLVHSLHASPAAGTCAMWALSPRTARRGRLSRRIRHDACSLHATRLVWQRPSLPTGEGCAAAGCFTAFEPPISKGKAHARQRGRVDRRLAASKVSPPSSGRAISDALWIWSLPPPLSIPPPRDAIAERKNSSWAVLADLCLTCHLHQCIKKKYANFS